MNDAEHCRHNWQSPDPKDYLGSEDWSYGGASRDRTDDPLLAKQVLSQLSYGPGRRELSAQPDLVGLGGFEPPTSPLSGVRSNQLSYRPELGIRESSSL